ncbi:MAG: calcium-binding protein, partial [Hyphomonadaceae bacterium]
GTSGSGSLLVRFNGTTFTEVGGSTVTGVENFVIDLASGVDTLRYATTANISVNLTTGVATGPSVLAGVENVTGDQGDDTLTGDGGANILIGNMGSDVLNGMAGNDTLNAGGANDTLIGGLGDDTMTGGGGSDTFVLGVGFGDDTITDFDANPAGTQDFLDVSALGITAANFAARVSIVDLGASTLITIDGTDTITLTGVNGNGNNVITQADFILGGP